MKPSEQYLSEQLSSVEPLSAPVVNSKAGPISERIDKLVNWLKWPAAMVAVVVSPLFAWALFKTLMLVITSPTFSLIPFGSGIVAFLFLWRRWLRHSRWGSFVITLEHESTHALFALLTGHPIIGFKASLGQGGEVRFSGAGNWLITVAPYFFPTAAIILFLLAYFLPFAALPWQSFLLGVALAYHIVSTLRETHRDQSDLHSLGRTFCWLFIPAANLAVVGLLIAFSHSGSAGMQYWVESVRMPFTLLMQNLGLG
jgi:Peptidase M50B-like